MAVTKTQVEGQHGAEGSRDGLQRAGPGHRGLAGYNWEESDFGFQWDRNLWRVLSRDGAMSTCILKCSTLTP